MYKNREIYNIACKSKVLTCLEMLFVRLVYINDLIICYSYCFNNLSNYCEVLIKFIIKLKKNKK